MNNHGLPIDSAQEKIWIAAAQAGDSHALDMLTQKYAPLVRSVSSRFYTGSALLTRDELDQSGFLGLILAIQHFDASKENALGAYALSWILGEMRKAVKTAVNQTGGYAQISKLKREASRYEAVHGKTPTVEILADLCQMPLWLAVHLMNAASIGLYDDVPAVCFPDASDSQAISGGLDRQLEIKLALEALEKDERQVIFLRYFRDQSQIETARSIGKSQAQISRIERRAIDHLKEMLI